MKAIVCEQPGPIEQLKLQELQMPDLQPGEIEVDIVASGVNFPDGLVIQGLYQEQPACPFIPGVEFAGRVSRVAGDVATLQPGDRVMAFSSTGAFAEKIQMPAESLIPLPEFIPFDEAAGLFAAYATAHHALRQRGNLQPGETLVVTGAAGGTGLAAVQIGKAMGAKVIAACSSADKLEIARQNGADILINYREQDLKTALKAVTGGAGVDVAFDPVGGDVFDALSRCMGWNGRLLIIGFASGRIPQLPANLALVKGYAAIGVFCGQFVKREPEAFAANMRELFQWYADGKIKVVIDQRFPLEKTVDALAMVMERRVKGKVIIINKDRR